MVEEEKIEIEFKGKAAEKLKKLEEETGMDAALVVSDAVSAYSSLAKLSGPDGLVTIIGPDGKRYVINIELKYKK